VSCCPRDVSNPTKQVHKPHRIATCATKATMALCCQAPHPLWLSHTPQFFVSLIDSPPCVSLSHPVDNPRALHHPASHASSTALHFTKAAVSEQQQPGNHQKRSADAWLLGFPQPMCSQPWGSQFMCDGHNSNISNSSEGFSNSI
jgi:hypothetical protein